MFRKRFKTPPVILPTGNRPEIDKGKRVALPAYAREQGLPASLQSYSTRYPVRPMRPEAEPVTYFTPAGAEPDPDPDPEPEPETIPARLRLRKRRHVKRRPALYRPATLRGRVMLAGLRLAAVARDFAIHCLPVALLLGIAFLAGVAIVWFSEGGR